MVLKANTDAFVPEAEVAVRTWSGPGFWIRWVAATALGWAVMLGALNVVAGLSGGSGDPLVYGVGQILVVAVFALQWAVLRPWMERAWRWIIVSFAGAAIGLALFLAALALIRSVLGGETVLPEVIAELLLLWLPPAAAQWMLLRTTARSAWRWLVANVVWMALFLPFMVGGALMQTGGATADMEQAMGVPFGVAQVAITALSGAAFGFVIGAITGAELAWLLRHPKNGVPVAE